MKRAAILLTVAALLLLVGAVWAEDGYDLSWRVIGGGGHSSSSADYALDGTAGQVAAETASGSSYTLAAGFWPGIGTESPTPTATPTGSVTPPPNPIYLPLVLKSYP